MKNIFFGLLLCSIAFTACVKNSTGVVLEKISLPSDTVKLAVGSNVTLAPTFTPSTFSTIAVQWTSSDPTVATVGNGGVINAVKSGVTKIVVKDQNSATMAKSVIVVQ